MNHWLLSSIETRRVKALNYADELQIYEELNLPVPPTDFDLVTQVANALEFATLDLLLDRLDDNHAQESVMKKCAADAFRLFRISPFEEDPLNVGVMLLRACALAVLGDRGADASRWLKMLEEQGRWPKLDISNEDDWGRATRATIIDIWLRLIRKKGWKDRDLVLERIAYLREKQEEFENRYLSSLDNREVKSSALELIALYHLAKAADIFAHFMTDGVVDGNRQVQFLLDMHFDRALSACEPARLVELEPLTRLLAATATQLVNNSLWTVTRAVNSRVTQFVRTLVDRGRGDKAIFDVLPPQRRTLAEKGLLGSSRRAVVVSLPTSSGKTLIAQFRILQALNQFDNQEGWVAYIAPTRALVNQVTRQLRRDFTPLNIIVERVSPALEVDGIEMQLLQETATSSKFRILVTTPEKLDLMLRQGWESKIGRPLTLVVVDEAHNIKSSSRGLKLELLLSTINKESENAQFLLLTPFIDNAREIARWLGGQNSEDISLSLDWQPNDRVIGTAQVVQTERITKSSFDYKVDFKTVHTSRHTLCINEILSFPKTGEIAKYFSQANKQGATAAIVAQYLKARGPVIVMHARPDWVWSLAEQLKIEPNKRNKIHEDVRLVQDYIRLELGDNFPLVDLLNFGIAVHHSGLTEEIRSLVEWLFEGNKLDFLVATTTIAQGINFPVSGVVMASHQYFSERGAETMPPEDFWNIAGRAGRVTQGQLGVVALAADSTKKAALLESFINTNTGDLNSALIEMAISAGDALSDLGAIVYTNPEWSSFLQYLAHTYRQMGEPESFNFQVEQVLRGTLGFEKLRTQNSRISRLLLDGIAQYSKYLQQPGQPLKLVDSTGFSLQSIKTVLANKGTIDETSWDRDYLFDKNNHVLKDMMGILLRVPELRENLKSVTGGAPDGETLSLIVKDWVAGVSVPDIAVKYFQREDDELVGALTRCGQNLFGKLTQTASWGLGALLAITAGSSNEEEMQTLSNLPSRVFYGVNSDEAIVLRLLGVPRSAAEKLAIYCGTKIKEPLPTLRSTLSSMTDRDWTGALGDNGRVYRKVWRILEGLDG
jgi:superfamily II DNA/RNA helicase